MRRLIFFCQNFVSDPFILSPYLCDCNWIIFYDDSFEGKKLSKTNL